jgi:hypothetical protein
LKSERSGLINPETFKMFDFRLLAAGDAGFHTKPSVLEELGHKRLRQYYLRYKADSQAGLNVTIQKQCSIYQRAKNDQLWCGCVNWNVAVAAS